MEKQLRRTWAEIDLSAVENNYNIIRNKIGHDRKYLAVVKANAYGHGAVRLSAELEKLPSLIGAISANKTSCAMQNQCPSAGHCCSGSCGCGKH